MVFSIEFHDIAKIDLVEHACVLTSQRNHRIKIYHFASFQSEKVILREAALLFSEQCFNFHTFIIQVYTVRMIIIHLQRKI